MLQDLTNHNIYVNFFRATILYVPIEHIYVSDDDDCVDCIDEFKDLLTKNSCLLYGTQYIIIYFFFYRILSDPVSFAQFTKYLIHLFSELSNLK